MRVEDGPIIINKQESGKLTGEVAAGWKYFYKPDGITPFVYTIGPTGKLTIKTVDYVFVEYQLDYSESIQVRDWRPQTYHPKQDLWQMNRNTYTIILN